MMLEQSIPVSKFRFKSLLPWIACLMLLMPLLLIGMQAEKNVRVMRQLEEKDDQLSLTFRRLSWTPHFLYSWIPDDQQNYFYYIDSIDVYDPNDKSALNLIGQVYQLEQLYFSAGENVDLKFLAKLTRLKELDISYSTFDDEELVHLSQLSRLENLSLESTDVSDKGLQYLSQLGTLDK